MTPTFARPGIKEAPSLPGTDREQIDFHKLYDEVAPKWGRDTPQVRDDFITWDLLKELVQRFGNDGVVLDSGCGTGNICRLIAPFFKNVIGLDISEPMIKEAERLSTQFKNIIYTCGDMRQLSEHIGTGSLDLYLSIFGCCCLTTIDQIGETFKEMVQAVKPSGHFIIQIPHPLDPFLNKPSQWAIDVDKSEDYFKTGMAVRRKLRTSGGDLLLVARHHFTISDYVSALTSAGVRILEILEPRAEASVVEAEATLARESQLPSSMIFIGSMK